MATEKKNSILRRKASDARDEFDARMMSPAKALRLALAKVADKMFGLALTVTTVEQVKLVHKDVREEVGTEGLFVLLDGIAGARGAVQVDTQFLTGLIEVQTTGIVRPTKAETRPVTRTDAAIVAPLLDNVLERYDAQLSEVYPDHRAEQFRFGDMMDDARLLSLALEDPEYDLYRLTLDLADGAKTGVLKLFLPHRKAAQVTESTSNLGVGNTASLEKNALEAQVSMDAVLARIKLPLRQICELSSGALLPLSPECLNKAELVASGGHIVARVRMGQMNGMRAVRFIAHASATKPQSNKQPDQSEEILDDVAETKANASPPSLQDDVVEGTASPLTESDLPGAREIVPTAEALGGPTTPGTGATTKTDVPPDSDPTVELTAADLLAAANALQDYSEDA